MDIQDDSSKESLVYYVKFKDKTFKKLDNDLCNGKLRSNLQRSKNDTRSGTKPARIQRRRPKSTSTSLCKSCGRYGLFFTPLLVSFGGLIGFYRQTTKRTKTVSNLEMGKRLKGLASRP